MITADSHESPFVESGTVPQIDAETPLYLANLGTYLHLSGTALFAHTILLCTQVQNSYLNAVPEVQA